MEAEKLQRLHDTLSKLAPRGRVGGLGLSAVHNKKKVLDPSLPNNALYSNFVRAGSGYGAYHKKKFDEIDEIADSKLEHIVLSKKDKIKNKKSKRDKTVVDESEDTVAPKCKTNEDDMNVVKKTKKERKQVKDFVDLNSNEDSSELHNEPTTVKKKKKKDTNKNIELCENTSVEPQRQKNSKKSSRAVLISSEEEETIDHIEESELAKNSVETESKKKKTKKQKLEQIEDQIMVIESAEPNEEKITKKMKKYKQITSDVDSCCNNETQSTPEEVQLKKDKKKKQKIN